MNAVDLMQRLAQLINRHQWNEMSGLLAPEFSCRYLHTGEEFDRDTWVKLNADYPGFDGFALEDCVGSSERAAGRAHVTGINQGRPEHFAVATFITVRDGLIVDMTEVWTDMHTAAPVDRRPQ